MKVLMYGWEFPPHFSGGLGPGRNGLPKMLIRQKKTEAEKEKNE